MYYSRGEKKKFFFVAIFEVWLRAFSSVLHRAVKHRTQFALIWALCVSVCVRVHVHCLRDTLLLVENH